MELGKETREVKVHVDNLTKRFGDLLVLDQISFDVYKGELLCVVGPTGCGKTTFLNCLTHIYDLTAGQILMDGKPVNAKTSNIAYIFQGDSTMPWLTVAQNVAFGLNIKHTPPKQRDELVDKYLDIVGLTKFRNYYPKQLSSSMLQRVSIARAFATEPELLLMDEPTSALDFGNQVRVLERVSALTLRGYTVLLSCHNPQHAMLYAQRVVALHDGLVAADGPPDQALDEALMRKLYGVPARFVRTGDGVLIAPVRKSIVLWTPDMVRFMADAIRVNGSCAAMAAALSQVLPPGARVCDAGCGLGGGRSVRRGHPPSGGTAPASQRGAPAVRCAGRHTGRALRRYGVLLLRPHG